MIKQAFRNKSNLLTNNHLNIETRRNSSKHLLGAFLAKQQRCGYGEEPQKHPGMKENLINKYEKKLKTLINIIQRRKTKLIGHLIRHNSFIKNLGRENPGVKIKRQAQNIHITKCYQWNETQQLQPDGIDGEGQRRMATSTRCCL
ncbi:MAG: hypothetical protein ACEY3A_04250 [Wolbachia sp.]